VAVPFVLLDCKNFEILSGNGFKLYILLCKKFWEEKNGDLPFQVFYFSFKKFFSKPTFYKCLKELVSLGFLKIVEKGSFKPKKNTIYKFSKEWTNSHEEIRKTKEYRNYFKPWGGLIADEDEEPEI